MQVDAHDDDVNAVSFADETSNILLSGSDDGLCKVSCEDRQTDRQADGQTCCLAAMTTDSVRYGKARLW